MAGSYRTIAHTADAAISVRADSLEELFAWAARAMCELMFDLDRYEPVRTIRITVDAPAVEELLVDALSELLYRSETDGLVPCRFTVVEAMRTRVHLEVGVAPIESASLIGAPIKAVTYHELVATESPDGGWSAQIVFDV